MNIPSKPQVRYRDGRVRHVAHLLWLLRRPAKELDHITVDTTGAEPSDPEPEAVMVVHFKSTSPVETFSIGWASMDTVMWWLSRRRKFKGLRVVIKGEERTL